MEKELRVLRSLQGIARVLELQGQSDIADELDCIRCDLLERYECLLRDAARGETLE